MSRISSSKLSPAAGLVLLAAVIGLGCPRAGAEPVAGAVTKPLPPVVIEQQPVLPPAPPPPSAAELALAASADAEARGDYARATAILEGALGATTNPVSRGDLQYRLGLLPLTLENPSRDPRLSIQRLKAVTEIRPPHPRSREAAALMALITDLDGARAEMTSLRDEQERLRNDVQSLRADLEKKDQELEKIKKALLEKQP
ncbi:MAG TPA: hypothetical protein VFG76_08455 [Candidatus Polarisedimenticolia bacterium]|nr:hypothetical protein [Candidatus Polarisedimenticolia bacterium]